MTRIITAAVLSIAALFALPAPADAAPITEDDPGWSCVDDGNRICGPHNPEGKPPGLYDAGGVLISPWPTVTLCTLPPGAIFDECDAYYVDPRFVHLTTPVVKR